jgi:hypothetical protein
MGFVETGLQGKWFDTVFSPSYLAYEKTMVAWRDPARRTEAVLAAMVDAEKKFITIYRELYNAWLKSSPLVTNEDLVTMGLPKRHSGTPMPAPVPTTWPTAVVNMPAQRRIKIDFDDSSGAHKRAKPEGVHGAEIRWAVFKAPQEVTLKELTHSSFDTRTPFILDFEEEERGHAFYFAMRWENTRGEKGPFSPIQEAIIP